MTTFRLNHKSIPLLFIGIGVVVVRFLHEVNGLSVNAVSLGQYALFPVVLWMLYTLEGVFEVPRSLLYFALLAWVAGLTLIFFDGRDSLLSVIDGRPSVLVARIDSGSLDSQTRILREDLSSARVNLSKVDFRSQRRGIRDILDAQKALRSNPQALALVWEHARRITAMLQSTPPIAVRTLIDSNSLIDALPKKNPWLRFEIVTSVQLLGISRQPVAESATFLNLLFNGLAHLRAHSDESGLLASLAVEGEWKSWAHRAYPLWILGNNAFRQALINNETAEARCAADYYLRALKFLRDGDNPDLRAALFNNLSLTTFLRSALEQKPELRLTARRALRRALLTEKEPNLYHTTSDVLPTVKKNIAALNKASKKKTSSYAGWKRYESSRRRKVVGV